MASSKDLSTKKLIDVLKDTHKSNSTFYLRTGLLFFGIFIVDMAIIFIAKIKETDSIAWVGAALLFIAMIVFFLLSKKEVDALKDLDDWYNYKITEIEMKKAHSEMRRDDGF